MVGMSAQGFSKIETKLTSFSAKLADVCLTEKKKNLVSEKPSNPRELTRASHIQLPIYDRNIIL